MRLLATQPVRAPLARAFEVFTDIEHCAGRVEGIRRIEVLSDARAGQGLRWRETRFLFGEEAGVEKEITAFDPPRSYRVESVMDGVRYVSIFDFVEGAEPGSTVVTWTHDLAPLTFAAKLMTPMFLVFRGTLRKAMAKDLADLAAFLERP